MTTRPSLLAIATALMMLLLAGSSFVAAMILSPLVFLPAALTFAAFATHITLATIPDIQAGFSSESHSFGVDTRREPGGFVALRSRPRSDRGQCR